MARTGIEIEQSIDREMSNYNELNALQENTSNASFWNYTKKVVVFIALTLEHLFDKHKEDVQTLVDTTETGSMDWYLNICLGYQHGDSLIVENNRPVYLTDDVSKQIIKRASIKEIEDADGNLRIYVKVVKEDTAENFKKLNATELPAFTTYLNRIKIVGTKIDTQSLDADSLELNAEVILDTILYDDEGKLLSDTTRIPVLKAIHNYIKTFDFGGVLYLSKLTDAVMDLEGVKDFYITSCKLNGTLFNRSIESPAGHIVLHENSNLNYVLS